MRFIPSLVTFGLLQMSFHLYAGFIPPKDVTAPANAPVNAQGYPLEVTSLVPELAGYVFHLVEGSSVKIGSLDGDMDEKPGKKPLHLVSLSAPIYMGVNPISNKQYESFPATSSHIADRGNYSKTDNKPATQIDFNDATAYVALVQGSAEILQNPPPPSYFLPTEAMWEIAARESGSGIYPWGNTITQADKDFYSKSTAKDVDKNIRATIFSHMVGNVFCWCQDWYDKDYYSKSPSMDPSGPGSGKTKSLRGGKWYTYDKSLRCADRWNAFPDTKSDFIGLRICRDVSGFVFN